MANYPTGTTKDKRSNCETIIQWFEGRIGDDELTDLNKEYFDRVKTCYKSQIHFEAKSKTIKKLCKTYDVSKATAQRIYAETEQIYGSQQKFTKEFKRHKAEEMALATFRKAQLLDSATGMGMATNAYIRASGIEIEDSDIPDFGALDPGAVFTVLHSAIESAIVSQLAGGVVDLNKANYTIDIPHEEQSNTTD